jgi:hypothetical protein
MDEHEVLAAIIDRLQRVRSGESRDTVYHRASACDRYEMWCRDAHDLANAILPKGKRPEPVLADGEWMILHDHTGEHYLTDEDSTAVLHWEAWIDFQDRLRSIRGD